MSTLYLVATPIGNLDDISPRALRTLREVFLIAAEDTRRTGKLLGHFGIETRMLSYHDHNKAARLEAVLVALQDRDVALVSDAGAPNLNDPGYELVQAAWDHGHTVSPIPGPSAPLAALTASGLPSDTFLYLGYLPRKSGPRRRLLEENARQPHTLVFLETPHRLLAALADMEAVLGPRPMAVARELTKLHEEIRRGTPAELRGHFENVRPRGEITLVIGGFREPEGEGAWTEAQVRDALEQGLAQGEAPASLAKRLAKVAGAGAGEMSTGWQQPGMETKPMQFDQPDQIAQTDPHKMLAEIDALPDQLEAAGALGASQPLPAWNDLRHVAIAGMGGSAIGADLLAAYAAPECRLPITVIRDYELPTWAAGPEVLVIGSSHSGNTEETLSVAVQAVEKGCRVLAVTTGGALAGMATKKGLPLWRFEHRGQPRAAVGYSFGLLLSAITRLGLLPDQDNQVGAAVAAMRAQAADLRADVPAVQNPAKRYAGQLMGRWFTVFGAEFLAPVARRWKTQINELAKAWAQFEALPEANHNALAGTGQPGMLAAQAFCMFLACDLYHPRNRLRIDLTRRAYMLEGISTDFYQAQGENRLAQQWTALHFGDYMAYYLAIAYGVDPTPVEALETLKAELKAHS